MRFPLRPNIVMQGAAAWAEDTCRVVRVHQGSSGPSSGQAAAQGEAAFELECVKPCSRCKVGGCRLSSAVRQAMLTA